MKVRLRVRVRIRVRLLRELLGRELGEQRVLARALQRGLLVSERRPLLSCEQRLHRIDRGSGAPAARAARRGVRLPVLGLVRTRARVRVKDRARLGLKLGLGLGPGIGLRLGLESRYVAVSRAHSASRSALVHSTVAPRQPTLQGRPGGNEWAATPAPPPAMRSSTNCTSLSAAWPEPVATAEDALVQSSGIVACPVATAAAASTCSTVAWRAYSGHRRPQGICGACMAGVHAVRANAVRMPCACTCGARARAKALWKHLVPHWREQRRERRARKDAGDEGDGPRSHCVRTTAARTTARGRALLAAFRQRFVAFRCREQIGTQQRGSRERIKTCTKETARRLVHAGTISES